jgi:hypothetical protein
VADSELADPWFLEKNLTKKMKGRKLINNDEGSPFYQLFIQKIASYENLALLLFFTRFCNLCYFQFFYYVKDKMIFYRHIFRLTTTDFEQCTRVGGGRVSCWF